MSLSPETAPRPPSVGPWAALALSAVVLPGLGQLLTGRMVRGAIMAGSLALWLPVALIKLGRDLALVMPQLTERASAGQALTFADLQAVMSPMADGLVWLFLPLIFIWTWALADSIRYLVEIRRIRN